MKRLFCMLVVCVMTVFLMACGELNIRGDIAPNIGDGINHASGDNISQTVNFDLTQYDAHGELSCGLIWVEKTAFSYDKAPETTFAYLDVNGNVKSPWFDAEELLKADFINGIVILREPVRHLGGGIREFARCIVYDTQFNELADDYFKVVEEDTNNYCIGISEANEKGEVFGFIYADNEKHGYALVMITSNGVVQFPVAEKAFIYSTVDNLERVKYENGFYIIDFRGTLGGLGNLPCYMGVFDEHGNCIIEPSEQLDYQVYSVKVISKNEFEIEFKGKDGNTYTATVDSTGEFLTEPK